MDLPVVLVRGHRPCIRERNVRRACVYDQYAAQQGNGWIRAFRHGASAPFTPSVAVMKKDHVRARELPHRRASQGRFRSKETVFRIDARARAQHGEHPWRIMEKKTPAYAGVLASSIDSTVARRSRRPSSVDQNVMLQLSM
ncbi:MAG: hypothetical protein JNM58_19085 [Xanthomonadaceae bacterium]|nr:hypothetical protein [Xanthomonadaceae bacterium]